MTNPLQLRMPVEPPHQNRYLFSDHYLENLLPEDPRWSAALPEAETFLAWLQDRYAREQDHLPSYVEDQLEEHWFKPIFRRLGHTFETRASVPGLDDYAKHPDYVFFPDEAARQAAADLQNQDAYADEALAVGEVKRWETPLGKKRKGGEPSFEDQNPSFQIDYYVRITGLDWGILTNGRIWRLVHQDSSQRLNVYYEVDLVELLSRGEPGPLRYFTLFFRQQAFRPDEKGRVFLDDVLAASNAYAVALEEDVEENVYHALEHLMQGFLDLPSNDLGAEDLRAIYDNSLYLLYRLLFILYGESRGLLPMDHEDYRTHFSLEAVKQDIAEGDVPRSPMTTVVWSRLTQLFRIINGDNAALNRSLGVPRYNGGLFDPLRHPFLEDHQVGDHALVEALDLLSRRVTEHGREFVDYRTLSVRHLGSIYEGLLEYQPRVADVEMVAVGDEWVNASEADEGARAVDRRAPGQVYLVTDRGERKATGSYYTPQYIVEYIVEHTLGPLIEEATQRMKTQLAEERGLRKGERQALGGGRLVDAILQLKVLDPAMGSGHFLVEATEYLARALATDPYVETEAAEEDLTHWKRQVVERSIYGVDKNPLAVELAKLSLWLATVAAERPLSFLDHHLKSGDILIGAQVEDLGWAPRPVLSKKDQKQVEKQKVGQINMFEHVLSQMLPTVMGRILEITEQESRDYDTVQAKEAADDAVRKMKAPFEAVADLWTSGYFGNAFDRGDYNEALGVISQPDTLLGLEPVKRARDMAEERRFFHWELAFPEVFYNEQGQGLADADGFDAVVGNPPYVNMDRVETSQSSYLNKRYPDVSMGQADYLYFFVARGVTLLQGDGTLGFVVARYFLEAYFAEGFRRFLQQNTRILSIVDFQNLTVFKSVGTKTCLLFLKSENDAELRQDNQVQLYRLPDRRVAAEDVAAVLADESLTKPFEKIRTHQSKLSAEHWVFMPRLESDLVDSIDRISIPLGERARVGMGMQTGANSVFEVSPPDIHRHGIEREVLRKVVSNMEIRRYWIDFNDRYWIYTDPSGEHAAELFPNALAYLEPHRDRLEDRIAFKRGDCRWYQFSYPRNVGKYDSPKLLVPFIAPSNRVAVDQVGDIYSSTDSQVIFPNPEFEFDLEYVAAVLNSTLLNWRYRRLGKLKDYRYEYSREAISLLPVRRIGFTTPAEQRAELVSIGTAEATEWIEAAAKRSADSAPGKRSMPFSAFSDSDLARWLDDRLSADPEQSDVVHDLLAHLAERMIAMHDERQERIEAFWLDLEGVTDPDIFEDL